MPKNKFKDLEKSANNITKNLPKSTIEFIYRERGKEKESLGGLEFNKTIKNFNNNDDIKVLEYFSILRFKKQNYANDKTRKSDKKNYRKLQK